MSFFNSLGRSMGRSSRPKKSPTHPNMPTFDPSSLANYPRSPTSPSSSTALGLGSNGKPLYLCQPFVGASLVKGSLKTISSVPKYVDPKEWVAVNLFDFFNNLNQFYGVLTEFCTVSANPTMSAGAGLDYTWIDQNRKQVKLPAPQYIDYVMTWVGGLLADEATFPTKASRDFPPTFLTTCKHIYKQLLRVFAHIYHAQFQYLVHLCCEGHFNSLFAHFIAFGSENRLFDYRDFKWSGGTAAGGGGAGAQSPTATVAGAAGVGGYPGVCDLIDKWVDLGVLGPECIGQR
ncbi:related to MOB2-required for maintenance in ploidy [Sporisorium reilianum SRZ2]|uniref:Related to MOB2-required for maintenance in ploidy n=2 Tax=Sporisorium reilianum TaxID=72558 RepID=E6ZU45_SPORE|nr:related to MOB2-required for maintenance in ploidy [Sporisorium reilianum SRZ2]SJX61429.1 related to MOB2-required for maintenance in ploidy [Sporisorium reilianum f. sp. reilianum]